MKGINLREFEATVLLTITTLVNNAYSMAIYNEPEKYTDFVAKSGVAYAILNRLAEKGLVKSRSGIVVTGRANKRKHFCLTTYTGKANLMSAEQIGEGYGQITPGFNLEVVI